ncbi:hypothetical protein PAPYR_7048 [Paratrimastix pyriformis]|uniref:Secreted protein n=1 Tax=Paratrimastix pyriformis TaxID=342808 RepID=A0ABQ8UJK1_9EUKA|nr:hypothetical protein PAPYR_7048 [Paratrimastix pyriformis]
MTLLWSSYCWLLASCICLSARMPSESRPKKRSTIIYSSPQRSRAHRSVRTTRSPPQTRRISSVTTKPPLPARFPTRSCSSTRPAPPHLRPQCPTVGFDELATS